MVNDLYCLGQSPYWKISLLSTVSNKAAEPILSIYLGLCFSWTIKLFIPCLANQLPSGAGSGQHCTQHTSFSITSNKILRSVFIYVGEIQDLW